MKLPASVFRYTGRFFNETLKPEPLFITGMLCMAVFLFIQNLTAVWIIVALFFILALLRRGKAAILPSVLLTLCITFFALLSPAGKVLITLGPLSVTEDALESGLHKSAVLCGMVFISQFAVSPRIRFPGKLGAFLAQVFTVFDQLTAKRISFKPGTVIDSIDARLMEIWNQNTADTQNK